VKQRTAFIFQQSPQKSLLHFSRIAKSSKALLGSASSESGLGRNAEVLDYCIGQPNPTLIHPAYAVSHEPLNNTPEE
jgi:hypothetical protein